MFPLTSPNQETPTSAMSQQGIQLLGNNPIQAAAAPKFDLGNFNTTAFQSLPAVTNMIKALKGGAQ